MTSVHFTVLTVNVIVHILHLIFRIENIFEKEPREVLATNIVYIVADRRLNEGVSGINRIYCTDRKNIFFNVVFQ